MVTFRALQSLASPSGDLATPHERRGGSRSITNGQKF
jgi:hypothetical protein